MDTAARWKVVWENIAETTNTTQKQANLRKVWKMWNEGENCI